MRINYIPSQRAIQAVWLVAAAVLFGLVAWLIWMAVDAGQRLDEADAQRADREARIEALTEAAERNGEIAQALAAQVRGLGERPVVTPAPGAAGPQGPQGEPGPAPTPADVQAAVSAFCSDGRCNGADPTTSQVAAAVVAYCTDRGDCRGPRGEVGADGEDGRDGADGRDGQDGADAPPPTQAQVDAAVAAYCDANGGCRGPKGEPGDDGTDAVPLTFSFTVQTNPAHSETFTCRVTEPGQTVTCTSSGDG